MAGGKKTAAVQESQLLRTRGPGGGLQAEEIFHGDLQSAADVRQQIDVRPAPAVLPVADGVGRNADLSCQNLLFHPRPFTEETDPLAQEGQGGRRRGPSCLHIDNARLAGGAFYTSSGHGSLLF